MSDESLLRIMLIGAGGHARVCLEALLDNRRHDVVGALSRDGTGIDALGVPVLGSDENVKFLTESAHATTAFVAIGDNEHRERATRKLDAIGVPLAIAASRYASVSSTATLADGVAVLPGASVNAATQIGRGSIVNTNASVDHDNRVGEFVHVAPGATIGGGVTIGDRVLIGIGATVLPNLTIGDGAVIGGGAVVVTNIPPNSVYVGVPARPLRHDR